MHDDNLPQLLYCPADTSLSWNIVRRVTPGSPTLKAMTSDQSSILEVDQMDDIGDRHSSRGLNHETQWKVSGKV